MDKKNEKRTPLRRLLSWLLTASLVAGAVCLILFREQLNIDSPKRYITYHALINGSDGQARSFRYDGDPENAFADLDGSLLVAGEQGARLYSPAGVLLSEVTSPMGSPAVFSSGKNTVVYDVGGTSLGLYDGSGLLFFPEQEGKLLSATVTSAGWLAVTHQESGHKGAVTIYDEEQSRRMRFNFSSRFVMDALLDDNASTAYILTAGQREQSFSSYLSLYSLRTASETGDSTPFAEWELGNTIPLSLRRSQGVLRILCDDRLHLRSADGASLGLFQYSDRYLKEFSLDGDGFTTLLLGKYRAGSSADLTVVSDKGTVLATLPFSEQVLSLSAAGRYIAVLTADRLDIYTKGLDLYSSTTGTQGARRVLMRSDGSALLIGSETVQLYLPQ